MKEIYYIIHSFSFGDTLAATPTLRYLSTSHNQKINVVSKRPDIFKNNHYVENIFSFDDLDSIPTEDVTKYESFIFPGKKDGNGIEKKFSHIDIRQVHAMDLGFQLLPHQMSYDYNPDFVELDYELPEKYVVCHITQNWPNRTWNTENWQSLIDWLSKEKIFTVLIGNDHKEQVHKSISDEPIVKSCPKLENLYGLDLTNKIELEEMYQLIDKCSVIVTMDSGPLHIAGCTDAHILQLGSATHPLLRIPYRNNTQNYKYDFVGGTCNLFCNSDLKYNVKEWGHINAVAPLTECSENKPTFECHPSVEKVIGKLTEILEVQKNSEFEKYIEFLPDKGEDKILYNHKQTSEDILTITIQDVKTGLYRDTISQKLNRLTEGNYWWAPMPGKVKNLGDIDLFFYLNDRFVGTKRLFYSGGKDFIINQEKFYFNIEGHNYPTFWEIFIRGEYEKESDCMVLPGDVVLDIGANYGFFTLNSIQKGAKKIYSLEPFVKAYNHLEELSKKFEQIIPIQKAISKENGVTSMFIDNNNSAVNCVTKYGEIFNNTSNETQVETININSLISTIEEKINFLKVDCEGSEYDLFQTITSPNLRKIERCVIETHGEEIDNFVYKTLVENHFEVKKYKNILYAINKNW